MDEIEFSDSFFDIFHPTLCSFFSKKAGKNAGFLMLKSVKTHPIGSNSSSCPSGDDRLLRHKNIRTRCSDYRASVASENSKKVLQNFFAK